MDGAFGGVARAMNSPLAMTAQIVTISEPTRLQPFGRRQPQCQGHGNDSLLGRAVIGMSGSSHRPGSGTMTGRIGAKPRRPLDDPQTKIRSGQPELRTSAKHAPVDRSTIETAEGDKQLSDLPTSGRR
jgi:hypothetical protein